MTQGLPVSNVVNVDVIIEAAHEKRESVSNKIRKLKLSRFN